MTHPTSASARHWMLSSPMAHLTVQPPATLAGTPAHLAHLYCPAPGLEPTKPVLVYSSASVVHVVGMFGP